MEATSIFASMKAKLKQHKKTKQLYLICTVSSTRMGASPDMEFTYDIAGISDAPWITIYEVRELTKKERQTIAKQ